MTTSVRLGREERLAGEIAQRLAAREAALKRGCRVAARRHAVRAGVLTQRLLRRLSPVVTPLCRRLAPYVRPAGYGPDDLAQESFLGLLRALRLYVPSRGRSVRAFVRTVLVNRFIGLGRRRAAAAVAELEPLLTDRGVEAARREALQGDVQDVLDSLLPDDPQRALKLWLFRQYYFAGYTLQELADRSGVKPTTVHRYLGLVRAAFRASYRGVAQETA
jgi:RNA polymerase sigma factor (sigma-70 family)